MQVSKVIIPSNIKDGVTLLSPNAIDSLSRPTVMLIGRVFPVYRDDNSSVGYNATSHPAPLEGITIVNHKTILVAKGFKVGLGTGVVPEGYVVERKIIVSGPVSLVHGDGVRVFEEANRPARDLSFYFRPNPKFK